MFCPLLLLRTSYLSTVSQSLAVFNLLPFPRLDGNEMVQVLVSSFVADQRVRKRCERAVSAVYATLVVCIVGLAVWESMGR